MDLPTGPKWILDVTKIQLFDLQERLAAKVHILYKGKLAEKAGTWHR